MTQRVSEILKQLEALADPQKIAGMQRYGIETSQSLGISIYDLRKVAKRIGVDHALAQELWETGIHEARILGSYIADKDLVDEALLERWVSDFNSWDLCDQVCGLFAMTPFAYSKAVEWAERPEEFVKRAGFALMAELAWHDKAAPDEKLAGFFPVIISHSDDGRNFVKKAVNWALRNLGKRSSALNRMAIETAEAIRLRETPTARWIAADAIRELTSPNIQKRLQK